MGARCLWAVGSDTSGWRGQVHSFPGAVGVRAWAHLLGRDSRWAAGSGVHHLRGFLQASGQYGQAHSAPPPPAPWLQVWALWPLLRSGGRGTGGGGACCGRIPQTAAECLFFSFFFLKNSSYSSLPLQTSAWPLTQLNSPTRLGTDWVRVRQGPTLPSRCPQSQ